MTQNARLPLRISVWNGATIRLSAPIDRRAPRSAVMSAMIRKMLNSSDAATRLALNTEESPVARLPVYAQAVKKVAATAGTTTFFRTIITPMITTMPIR